MRALVLALLLVSCTPLTEAQRDEIEYRRVEAQIEFEAFVRACTEAGGIVCTKGRHIIDLKMARCVRGPYECMR